MVETICILILILSQVEQYFLKIAGREVAFLLGFIPEYYVSSLFRIRFSIYCLTKLENYLTKILGEGVYFYIFVKILLFKNNYGRIVYRKVLRVRYFRL